MDEVLGTILGWCYVCPHMALALSQLMFIYVSAPYVNMVSCGDKYAIAPNS